MNRDDAIEFDPDDGDTDDDGDTCHPRVEATAGTGGTDVTNKEYADGLRAIADWFEAHPDVPTPDYPRIDVSSAETKEEALVIARALGSCTKTYGDTTFTLAKDFGGIHLSFNFWRSAVCERRVIGVLHVPASSTPAHDEEIVEWECSPLLEGTA